MAKINISLAVPMVFGLLLIIFGYITYLLVIPPFYTLESFEIRKTSQRIEVSGANLTTNEPGWLIFRDITRGQVGEQSVIRRADFNISLELSLKIAYGSQGKEVNVTVYIGPEALLERTLNESAPISDWNLSKQFPMGTWKFGLENPQMTGHEAWVELENSNPSPVKLDIRYEGECYYREGSLSNFFFFLIGIILLVGSILHSLYIAHRKRLEQKMREMALKSEEVS